MRRLLPISEADCLLAVTTLSFDIAALEIFLPLVVGARVEIVDRDVAADGSRLAARLDDPQVTFLQATPATWRMLLEAGWQGKPTLTLLCGGEALPRALADRLVGKGSAVWNLYGPTETTIWSSVWQVEAGGMPISIGRPIANTRSVDPRQAPAGGSGRGDRRAVHWRHRAGPRLSRPPGAHGRAVHPRPVRPHCRWTALPYRGPCPHGAPMGRSNVSGGLTIRSRCGAFELNWARSKPRWLGTPACARPSSRRVRIPPAR